MVLPPEVTKLPHLEESHEVCFCNVRDGHHLSIVVEVKVVVNHGVKSRVAGEGDGIVAGGQGGEHTGLQVHGAIPTSFLGNTLSCTWTT